MIILYLLLTVYSFSVKLSSFVSASKVELVCTIFICVLIFSRKYKMQISRLLFDINAIVNCSIDEKSFPLFHLFSFNMEKRSQKQTNKSTKI